MRLSLLSSATLLLISANAQTKHGDGEEGKSMGPVAFLWPADRPWTALDDNRGPCGSPQGVGNRTNFPLAQGSVALSIADDAWFVAFRISYSNNPTRQVDFSPITTNVTDIDPGHQCYKLNQIEGKAPGTNATIQMEYWAEFEGENNGNNQSFFACADVTLVESKDFTTQVPCFNVTSDTFDTPTPSSTPPSLASFTSAPSPVAHSSNSGLSTGTKAGIAVGAILGGLALLGGIAFFVFRRGKATGLRNRDSYELRAKKLGDGEASTRSAPSTNAAVA